MIDKDRKKMVELENKLFEIIKNTELTFSQVLGVLEILKLRIKDELDKAIIKEMEEKQKALLRLK